MDADVDQEPEAEHHREHRRAAIGNQRQGHANDWEQAHHHPGVDKEIKEEAE